MILPGRDERQPTFAATAACPLTYDDSAIPLVFRQAGFRFFFYSNEGSPREPVHVQVMGKGGEAKFWLRPAHVAHSLDLDARTLRELASVVDAHSDMIERARHEYFG